MALPHQLVQAAHAAHASGGAYGYRLPDHLICLQVSDEPALLREFDRLKPLIPSLTLIREPDMANGATAISTGPLTDRSALRGLPLWKGTP